MLLNEPTPYEVLGPPAKVRAKRPASRPGRQPSERPAERPSEQPPGQLWEPEPRPEPEPVADVDLTEPLPPERATGVLELLGPVLDEPVLVVERPALPPMVELVVLHRAEAEAEFEEPPASGAGDEPPIPSRFTAGFSVLSHIDFPS